MKPQAYRLILVAAIATMLAACAGTPTQFYTLIPAASTTPAADATSPTFQIAVLPVDIPDQVDRPQMVVREGNGGIVPVETRQWIAPLASEIRGALSTDLSNNLGNVKDVYGIAAAPGMPTYTVKLNVQRFDSALGAYAHIAALWTVRTDKDSSAAPVCSSSVNIAVTPGYAELALGHQRALAQIADDIAVSIRNARQGSAAPVCPVGAAR